MNPSPSYVPWDNNLAQQNLTDEFTNAEDGTLDYEVHNPSEQGTGRVEVRVIRGNGTARALSFAWRAEATPTADLIGS